MLDDFHYVGNLNGEPRIVPAISPKQAPGGFSPKQTPPGFSPKQQQHAASELHQKHNMVPLSPIPKRIKYSPMR